MSCYENDLCFCPYCNTHQHWHTDNHSTLQRIGIMLIPSDSNGVVNPATRQKVGNMMASIGFDTATMQNVDSMLASGTVSQFNNLLVWHRYGLKVVSGDFQPEIFYWVPSLF